MIESAVINLFTDGIGSIAYGALRPVCFLAIAIAVYRAPLLTIGKWPMILGSLGNFTASVAFLFANAEMIARDSFPVEYAELAATPALVLFTFGFIACLIRLAGLRFGHV